jgi:demethylmenaquinone methyltransferase / 2-methoxy-6-polyprenyl-1,4-benzoquinol methylase
MRANPIQSESAAQSPPVRAALSLEKLRGVYDTIAKRYDAQHALITARADQKGRRLLVETAVKEGDTVLDCGSGTGTTALMAAGKVGAKGKVTLFDLSEGMLAVAREKAARQGLLDRLEFQTGDMVHLPFADDSFDVVLSTYSLCPLYDPKKGALELYRVTRPGGRIGVAHSTTPRNAIVRWLADRVEDIAWRMPWLSMGCRAVVVLPTLQAAGARVVFLKHIGVPLWPFLVFVLEKPDR